MRQYFCHLRLYRIQDQHYWTLGLQFTATSLGDLENQLKAFEMGLRVAGAGKLYLENVGIDTPPDGGHYSTVDDPNIHLELQYFLGLKRDRRHKPPAKTETETGAEGSDTEKENGSENTHADA